MPHKTDISRALCKRPTNYDTCPEYPAQVSILLTKQIIVDGDVYGVDLDPILIDRARAELERNATSVLGMICADARDLEHILPGKVDFVLIANTFHGVPDKTELARAAAAVLRPAGTLAIVNWQPLPREHTVVLGEPRGPKTEMRMSPDDVGRILEPAGFTLEKVIDLAPYHYAAVYRMPLV